jgi:hypothetical protein
MRSNAVWRARRITRIPEPRVRYRLAPEPKRRMPPPNMSASATNTREKPSTKAALLSNILARRTIPPERLTADSPEMMDTYTGIRGNTQGLRNDRRPARKAADAPGSSPIIATTP